MLVAFGPFAFAFEPIVAKVPPYSYMRLMGITPSSVPRLDAIRSVVSRPDAPGLRDHVAA